MTILRNDRLEINIEQVGTVYSRSRFDWTGFISQITLDKKITFCVPEQYQTGKGTGGIGFCNEFGIDQPIGYDSVNAGGTFPKIGVGNLIKMNNEAYDFFQDYEVNPCHIEEKLMDEQTYVVTSTVKNDKGYSIELTKKIELNENRLIINYFIKNNGEKAFSTNEYCHNFMGINALNKESKKDVLKKMDKTVNRDQRLFIPSAKRMNLLVGQCQIRDKVITWKSTPEDDFYLSIELEKSIEGFAWEYVDEKLNAGVRDWSKFPISKCAIWGTKHVVSPELFIQLEMGAGEVREWRREYEFFISSDS